MSLINIVNIETLKNRFGKCESSDQFIIHRFDRENEPKWEPCRMEVYFIAFLQKGELLVESDLLSQKVKAPAIFAMAPAVIRKFIHSSSDFESEVIFFDKSFFLQNLSDTSKLDHYSFFYHKNDHNLLLNKSQNKIIRTYFNLIKRQVKKSGVYRADMIRSILQILLFEIAEINSKENNIAADYSHTEVIMSIFKDNLEKHFRNARKVGFFASLQNLSNKYFSGIVQRHAGKTAGEMIDERVILEAKALLQNKSLTVSEISGLLSFDDVSNFGKYFKNLTGDSPMAYRKLISK
ncbi:helix-turn-helix domain-containing protein [Pedobacter sp. L105]|uniref:helix-turn-helix domain-containing protein n=1 Tax=Pedobacter sp. L105 TaxID=1641871 RepID=UPI00131E78DE|nr:helix-turn-helix domain-containing protein [Pedobacter sp. L105]